MVVAWSLGPGHQSFRFVAEKRFMAVYDPDCETVTAAATRPSYRRYQAATTHALTHKQNSYATQRWRRLAAYRQRPSLNSL